MKLPEIQDLIKFVAKTGVSEVEIEQKDFKIIIKKEISRAEGVVVLPQAPTYQASVTTHAPVATAPSPTKEMPSSSSAEDDSKYITVKSPMIGTFYRKPSPDKPNFVEVGKVIKPGDVICIIEAMKLFNEIESEVSGKVVKILVDDTTPVEYDQPLFLVEPA